MKVSEILTSKERNGLMKLIPKYIFTEGFCERPLYNIVFLKETYSNDLWVLEMKLVDKGLSDAEKEKIPEFTKVLVKKNSSETKWLKDIDFLLNQSIEIDEVEELLEPIELPRCWPFLKKNIDKILKAISYKSRKYAIYVTPKKAPGLEEFGIEEVAFRYDSNHRKVWIDLRYESGCFSTLSFHIPSFFVLDDFGYQIQRKLLKQFQSQFKKQTCFQEVLASEIQLHKHIKKVMENIVVAPNKKFEDSFHYRNEKKRDTKVRLEYSSEDDVIKITTPFTKPAMTVKMFCPFMPSRTELETITSVVISTIKTLTAPPQPTPEQNEAAVIRNLLSRAGIDLTTEVLKEKPLGKDLDRYSVAAALVEDFEK